MERRTSLKTATLDPVVGKTPSFESFTKKFLSSPISDQIQCPSCKNAINFNGPIKWHGPDTFTCSSCDRYLSMRLVERALRDLRMRSFETPEM